MLDAVVYMWALAWINKDVAQKWGSVRDASTRAGGKTQERPTSNEADIHPNKKRDAKQTRTGMPERRDQVGDRVQVAKDAVEAFICTRAAGLVSPSITIQGPNDGPSDELNVVRQCSRCFLGRVASSAEISVTLPRTVPPSSGCATTVANRDMSPLLVLLRALSLRNSATPAAASDTSKNCGRIGHIARACPTAAGGGFASRAPPPGRSLNTSTLPPVKCYRDCLATPGTLSEGAMAANKNKTCYKCQQEGHIARDCPEADTFVA
ncbi:hypothetical protein CPB85DRAFT_1251250 [Mucidula mucida]|nr:hypothetical protein CPB85DRAFT_1251250 [Mucidula mucida]